MYGCGGASPGQPASSTPFGSASAGFNGVVVVRYTKAQVG
jgi:hypothetical protein